MEGELDCTTVTYKGSGKLFFQQIVKALDIPISEPKLDRDGEEIDERPLTLDQLKEEILMNVGQNTLLILPESKRLTTGIRYWLEDAIAAGVRMCCFATRHQRIKFMQILVGSGQAIAVVPMESISFWALRGQSLS